MDIGCVVEGDIGEIYMTHKRKYDGSDIRFNYIFSK